ncbi:MAG: hypothetical protein ACJARP_002301 [Vicingaceae bacterium]|jgi:hypothetical protein
MDNYLRSDSEEMLRDKREELEYLLQSKREIRESILELRCHDMEYTELIVDLRKAIVRLEKMIWEF